MEKAEFEQLISQLETDASSVKYDFQIAEFFEKLLDENKVKLTPEQDQKLRWEFLLFRLTTKNKFASDGTSTDRFVPMAIFEGGGIFPDPNSLTPALEYFEERAKMCTNSILKARYLDILWEKSQSKSKHLFAIEAVSEYLSNVDQYENEEAIMERLDGLQRATELALIIEKNTDKKILTNKIVSKLNEQIESTSKTGKCRWLIEMFELVVSLISFYSNEELLRFASVCDLAVDSYHKESNFHIQRHFLALKSQLLKSVLPTSKQEIDEAIGQTYLDEADAKSDSGIVRAHFLQEAVDHFNKLGNKKKVDELISQIKDATKQAIDNKEFKQFSSTIELKPEDEKSIKESLGKGEEVPERMGTVSTFFPNWNHAVKMTEDHSKKFVFMHLAKKVTFGSKYPISDPRTPEKETEDQVMGNFQIEVQIANQWLTIFLGQLIEADKVSAEDFRKFFSKLELIDPDTYSTVMEGVNLYFEGKHFQAVCVLAPQLEDLLRHLLSIFGGQTTTLHKDAHAFTEKNLNRILAELRPHISDELFHYISWVMDDYRGYNLRYMVGHGFFKTKHGSTLYSTALLHIFCVLIANTNIVMKVQEK
ncbi:DUF4209 domain-containing protein [Candidatus Roizmanbacteria bacterium]|nr:DUF4209 domain-containing protein [Candidatus Roizmanbacteria bacterium]